MSTLRARLNIEECLRGVGNLERYFSFSSQQLVNQLADSVSEHLRSALSAHDRTGKLSASIHKYPIEAMGWKYTQYVSVGGERAPHARFFFEGTQPSPGRYIPVLGRRYSKAFISQHPERAGWHPGTPPHREIWNDTLHFAEREIDSMRGWLRSLANEYV